MKPIYLNEDDKKEIQEEFMKQLNRGHLFNGGFSFSRNYAYEPNQFAKARILYTPLAYIKMQSLLAGFASEIAWHGLVVRGEDRDFIVYDIITHKQTVTGSTVTTDDEEYRDFLMSLTDEQAAHLCLQGHSHVNMATNPSGTDLTHQAKIVADKCRKKRGFQIFQIWNKNMKVNSFLYDFDENIYFEDKDIEVDVILDVKTDYLVSDFLSEAKALVTTKTYNYQQNNASAGQSAGKPANKTEDKSAKSDKSKPTENKTAANKPNANAEKTPETSAEDVDPYEGMSDADVEALKAQYRRWFHLGPNYDVEQDEDWWDFVYYKAYGISGGMI